MYAIDIKYTRELLTGDTVGLRNRGAGKNNAPACERRMQRTGRIGAKRLLRGQRCACAAFVFSSCLARGCGSSAREQEE